MSYNAEQLAIEAHLIANWSETLMVYQNVKYDGSASEWCRMSLQNADAFQASMGVSPAFRYIGVMFIQIFVRPDTGSGRAMAIADAVTTMFRAQTISGITFRVPQIQKVGEDDGWYQVNVSVDFFRGE